ncbi:AsmA family protein [Rhizobium sp. ARZ01]|uniref:AsmA family protein n=1 Tax=Rhizobium sp. ARZ01 TaxID=2769313 RepID=UPI001781B735|nr:AsmA-like C-terminal region-containing protein [Rhizobium sp. ARZ01]MBD9373810.1 AsmA family protein [Rhizobium sp. ARZ01]
MGSFNLVHPRNLLRLFAAMAALALILRLAGPFLVSTDRVEREIEAKLSGWMDTQMSFSGTPSFTVWPYPEIGFEHVRLRNSDGGSGEDADLVTAERISASISLIGYLFGAPDLGDIEMIRPTFHFRRYEDGALNWRAGSTLEGELTETQSKQQRIDTPPDFGTVVIRDGTVVVDDLTRYERYNIANVEGSVAWPNASSDLEISLQGVLNGEAATWTFTTDEPMNLLDGRDAAVRTSLASDPLTIDFEGTANLSKGAFTTGKIRIGTPSFGDLLAWRGTSFTPGSRIGSVALEGTVTTSGHAARLDNLALTIQGSNATGVLDISIPPRDTPSIAGTLAFDQIDLLSMIDAYAPLAREDDGSLPLSVVAAKGIDLDMRISAKEATFEPLLLTDFAAGIRSVDGEASLDIGDGTLLGGNISGRIAARNQELKQDGELRLSLRDVDLGELVSLSGLTGPLPTGRGAADIDLFTDQRLQRLNKADVTGTFRLSFQDGSVTNFDLPAFEQRAQGETVFKLEETSGGSFEFATATLEGHVDRGIAELSKAIFEGAEKTLSISGIVPYRDGNVALAGSLADSTPPDAAIVKPAVNFLVGGSWPKLAISPVGILLQSPAN